MDHSKFSKFAALALFAAFGMSGFSVAQEETVESLYQEAASLTMAGENVEASAKFERLFEVSKGIDRLFEDYGAQAGGLLFDYGMTLLPQQRWEEAKKAFSDSVNATETAKALESPVNSTNARENLARFQLGFAEAQLGNHEEALRLYDEYLAKSPSPEEMAQVRNSFKLRYGGSLMKVGKVDEGIAVIQELFDNQEAWKVSAQFLMQGVLELGLVWVDLAVAAKGDDAALEKIAAGANAFLDKNGSKIYLGPLDQFRLGIMDKLRKLGFESTRSGLYTLALRFFAYVPTIEDIRRDLYLTLARQPIGSEMPSQYQKILDDLAEREKAPLHPDAETLRLVASCYERIGNLHAPRVIYWHLAEQFPEAPAEARSEILHEAARFASLVGDYSGAQYFGEKFATEMADDHPLRNNVSTFMLQSLFTSRGYEEVIRISESVRERFPAGDPQRELADSLHPLALYALQRHEDADPLFHEYVKNYPGGGNREIVFYHLGSNLLILRKMREAAETYEDFLKEFPESEPFLDGALADLAIARFNLGDYPAAVAAADRIVAERP